MPGEFTIQCPYLSDYGLPPNSTATDFVIFEMGLKSAFNPREILDVVLVNKPEAEGGEELILVPIPINGSPMNRVGPPPFAGDFMAPFPGQTVAPGGQVNLPVVHAKPNLEFNNLGPDNVHVPGFYCGVMRLSYRWASDSPSVTRFFSFVCFVTISDETPENTPVFDKDAFRRHTLAYYSNMLASYPVNSPWGGSGLPRGDFYSVLDPVDGAIDATEPINRPRLRESGVTLLMHMWVGNMRDPNGVVSGNIYQTPPVGPLPGDTDFLFGNIVNWRLRSEYRDVIQWGIDNNRFPAELDTPDKILDASVEYFDSMCSDGSGGVLPIEIYEGSMRAIPEVLLSEPRNNGDWKSGWAWYKQCYDFYLTRPHVTLHLDVPYGFATFSTITSGQFAGNTTGTSRRGWAEGGRDAKGQDDYFDTIATNIFQFYDHIKKTQKAYGKKTYAEPLTTILNHEWSVDNDWHRVAVHNSSYTSPNLYGPAGPTTPVTVMSLIYQDMGDMVHLDAGTTMPPRRSTPPEHVNAWFAVQRRFKICHIVNAVEYSMFTGQTHRAALYLWLYDALLDEFDDVVDEIQQILITCHAPVNP